MTITRDIACLLGDGVPRSVAQITEALGLTERQVWSGVGQLMRRGGRVTSLPTLYTVTERGKTQQATRPKTKEELSAVRAVYDKERRRKNKLAGKVAPKKARVIADPENFPRRPAHEIVKKAIASRPPLQAFWSAATQETEHA